MLSVKRRRNQNVVAGAGYDRSFKGRPDSGANDDQGV